ncbi:MAG TPA: amidase family protein [Rhizomicrobium sp.]|nr:amidase family protein [Rhizomicrobium sp.]
MNPYATAREMLADLAAKRISARELLDAHVARNEKIGRPLNAVIAMDLERASRDAARIDDARAKGAALGALAGLPMTIKDVFDVDGMPAVVGHPALVGRPKNVREADVVASARGAGAVIWGKTNVPLMAGDMQTFNSVYGTTNNPFDVTRTTGGSSGGAAAALSTGITPLEIGSDIGGSLRHPANFCGVCSLKPTWGALSQRGHIPPLPEHFFDVDLNVVGPMARNSEDLKLLWGVLRGTKAQSRKEIKGARVALWDEDPGVPVSREVKARIEAAANALADAGAIVERAKPFEIMALMPHYLTLLASLIACGFPDEIYNYFASSRAADLKFLADTGKLFSIEAYRASSTATFKEVAAANAARQKFKDALADFFASGWDAIISPLDAVTAFPHQQEAIMTERILDVDGEQWNYLHLLDWIAVATALHAPAMAVPAGRTASGLPVGVQIVGRWDNEDRLFDFGAAIEERLGGFAPPAL